MQNRIMARALKVHIISALLFLFMVPSFSQVGSGSKFSSSADSINYMRLHSFYWEFFKIELYEHAIGPWWDLYYNYPAYSEKLYLDGVSMYRIFIEASPNGPDRESLIDTLMLIYDQRMEYFGGEGNVLGRKGRDLFTYGRADIEQVQKAYAMLKKSIELEGKKSRESVMLSFLSACMILNRKAKIDDNQVVEDYFSIVAILDQLEEKSSRWERTRAIIDELMLKENMLSCEALNSYYEPRFEQSKNDKTFLEKLISFYSASGCKGDEIYVAACENLYIMAPGPESAHNLAILFISRDDYPKAVKYLQMAVLGEDIGNETRAEWFYKLAVVCSANKDYCEAIAYAREAIAHKSDYGKAYMTLGDLFIASRTNLEDDFNQKAAFWAAADKYTQAALLDPSLTAEVNQKLAEYKVQYPDKEEIFFRDMKDGDSYRVKGCIKEYTTVRSGD
jgi:tetratricopeptide (TPR) repeat protein